MLINQLTGQLVNATLRANVPLRLQGTLLECDEITICLDQGDEKPNLYIPLTSILHIEPVQDR